LNQLCGRKFKKRLQIPGNPAEVAQVFRDHFSSVSAGEGGRIRHEGLVLEKVLDESVGAKFNSDKITRAEVEAALAATSGGKTAG
jgi:hypothetical protein